MSESQNPIPRPDYDPAPPAAVSAAPRGKRSDHLISALLGLVLGPTVAAAAAIALQYSGSGRLLAGFAAIIAMALMMAAAHVVFALRSCLGGLVAAAVIALMALLVASTHQTWNNFYLTSVGWLLPSGALPALIGLLAGGSLGIKVARREGREAARVEVDISSDDLAMGVTPTAPPSRRGDHIATLIGVTVLIGGALWALTLDGNPATGLTAAQWIIHLAAIPAFAASAWSVGRSSVGARVVGTVALVAGIPLFVHDTWHHAPFNAITNASVAEETSSLTVLVVAMLLLAIGWSAHTARQAAHEAEIKDLRRKD